MMHHHVTDKMAADPLNWSDYLEVTLLALACLLGLLGNMAVLRASFRIRAFSRQISVLFTGIVCADILVCGVRIPTTIYLIFSPPEASEVWAAGGALLVVLVWLHLAAALHRVAIIFSFHRCRRLFTPRAAGVVVVGAWVLGSILVYVPLRALGLGPQRAGRGACRADDVTPDSLLTARSVLVGTLCLLPLLATSVCYVIIVRSVLLAREVSAESQPSFAAEFNRVVYVTLVRMVSLALTFVPVCVILMLEATSGMASRVPWEAHRYAGHLLWLQSALSPWITLQDNDFRSRVLMPTKHAPSPRQTNGNGHAGTMGGGEGGGGGGGEGVDVGVGEVVVNVDVLPDIGSSGGQDDDEHRARNLREMNREMRKSQLKRGLSFISASDMKGAWGRKAGGGGGGGRRGK